MKLKELTHFTFIKEWIDEGIISPAIGRLIEASIWSLIGYLVGVAYEGDIFSFQALIQAIITPLAMYVRKKAKDNTN